MSVFCFLRFHTRILFKSRSFWARLMKNVLFFSMFFFPSLVSCLTLAWVLLKSCLTLAWLLLDSCLSPAWVLLDSCLSLAWVLLHSCFSLVPRLKLVFRGSYFLLLIGSGGPPRKRLAQASPAFSWVVDLTRCYLGGLFGPFKGWLIQALKALFTGC